MDIKYKKFWSWSKERKKMRAMQLWRSAFNISLVCSIFIDQFNNIQTKMHYFGRHMISVDNVAQRNQFLLQKFNNPKWIVLWFPNTKSHNLWDLT